MTGRADDRAPAALAACQSVGAGARVRGRVDLENRGRIDIGRDFSVRAEPVSAHLVTAPGAALTIGDRVSVAHGVGIAAHAGVSIGDDTVVGPFAMILDTDFHVVGDRSARPACTPIRIGRGVRIGAHATVLRGATVGDGATIEPGSVVGGDVPAGAHVGGVPARRLDADGAEDRVDVSPDAVAAVVARALGLPSAPPADADCESLRGWDSLGALNVLLSLEDAFGVELGPNDVAAARRVRDLADRVAARAAAARSALETAA